MENRSSPGSAQPIAALLRPLTDVERKARDAGQQQGRRPRHSEFAVQAARKPVLETSEFMVIEPDGTEDPWASADDGLLPEKGDGTGPKDKP